MKGDYEAVESSQRQHDQVMYQNERMCNEAERHAISIVKSLEIRPYLDGNKWCVLWGKNIQEGIAGFSDTPMQAVMNFYEKLKEATNGK